ncbi:MAG: TonB-dependent receptor plug domain-containing protein [Bacteroidales bacterium]|nr:TonB-dependent receptor plug domain-containing protein [Bacteroidales bacterium]
MKKLKSQLLILLLIVFFCVPAGVYGQELMLEGKVTTYDSIPVVNAQVKAKGTKMEVYTDKHGNFEIKCTARDKITVSAKGFRRGTVKLTGMEDFLDVDLELKPGERNLELALGPDGHIRDADKQKISTINDRDIDFSMYSNIFDALRGRIAGVHVVGDNVYIRGQTNLSGGDSEALFVVDGVIVSKFVFSSTPTSDIQNIRVLKGSAASIYGSRGGNGVVEVDTKRGKFK